jgi:hypothetical protein
VDYGPFFGPQMFHRKLIPLKMREALQRLCERCRIQGVRRLNGHDVSTEDRGFIAADRWRRRCTRQAAERELGEIRPRGASSG